MTVQEIVAYVNKNKHWLVENDSIAQIGHPFLERYCLVGTQQILPSKKLFVLELLVKIKYFLKLKKKNELHPYHNISI